MFHLRQWHVPRSYEATKLRSYEATTVNEMLSDCPPRRWDLGEEQGCHDDDGLLLVRRSFVTLQGSWKAK